MGSFIELNDTLQITTDQGFPADILDLEKHKANPIQLKDLTNKVFEFRDKPNPRIYHLSPVRCFLVHNIDGKWLYWGKVNMLEQTIKSIEDDKHVTSGRFEIIEIYDPEYQRQITLHETSPGLSYFKD